MPGNAILDPDVLVDSLVTDVIDGLRGDLHPAFGVRAYRVYTVHRTWSGQAVGEGEWTDVVTEIDPQPMVEVWSMASDRRYELAACGLDELGQVRLREVSLTYTEADLVGPRPMPRNHQWFIAIGEAHGQESRTVRFLHAKPPYIDREKDMGWVVWLRVAPEGSC